LQRATERPAASPARGGTKRALHRMARCPLDGRWRAAGVCGGGAGRSRYFV